MTTSSPKSINNVNRSLTRGAINANAEVTVQRRDVACCALGHHGVIVRCVPNEGRDSRNKDTELS